MTASANDELLRMSIMIAVPLWLESLQHVPWDRLELRAQEAADMIAEHGDNILYRSKKRGATAEAFNRLAEGVAILAFAPGGVDFLGMHFEAEHHGAPWRRRKMVGDTCLLFEPCVFPAVPYEIGDEVRASGGIVCRLCNMIYLEHPRDMEYEFLHVLCDGKRVKL